MKKALIVLIALLTAVAFVSGVIAQEKKAEPPAPAAEKAKAEKPKAPKAMRASGIVSDYQAGKMIKMKGAKEKEWTFDIGPDAKVKGEPKEGAKVTVMYKKEGDKMIATAISVAAGKKAKAEKKK
jgi:Na+-transporting methylmalonyl-CoA/oxaloacetate decarboxylase gamma subunit